MRSQKVPKRLFRPRDAELAEFEIEDIVTDYTASVTRGIQRRLDCCLLHDGRFPAVATGSLQSQVTFFGFIPEDDEPRFKLHGRIVASVHRKSSASHVEVELEVEQDNSARFVGAIGQRTGVSEEACRLSDRGRAMGGNDGDGASANKPPSGR